MDCSRPRTQQWLSEETDLFLRSDEGGRALFWYGGEDALLMIEDPARAGIQIEITNVEGARRGDETRIPDLQVR